MLKNSPNIIIRITKGIFHFFQVGFLAFLALFFWKNFPKNSEKFAFFQEIFESWPKRFFAFPTAIRLGRAIFAPIVYLFSPQNPPQDDQKNSQK